MDLNQPLGVRPPQKGRRPLALITVSSLATLALAGGIVFFATADPHGGEPYAVTTIPPAALPSTPDTMPTGSLARSGSAATDRRADGSPNAPSTSVGTIEGGIKVFRGGKPSVAETHPTPQPLIIDVTKVLDDPYRKKALPTGAAPVVIGGAPATGAPRVAIFVGGMGLSATATRTATETMPPAVDLAFVPTNDTVSAAVDAAKAKGHEILLQVPMQTAQGTRSGLHALRPDEPPQELADDLGWLLGRFGGYVGVTNLLGAPVTANAATMTALLKTVAARRLFYLDDGTSKRSVAASLAPGLGVSSLQADVVIDATGDPAIVRANLDRLMTIARRKGHAIGMASGLPDHLSTIARFAAGLGGHGLTLVPLSVLAGRDASIATAR